MNNFKTFFGIAIIGCALSSASALLGTLAAVGAGTGSAITFTGLGATTGTTVFATAAGAAIIGGAALLKTAAVVTALNEIRGRLRRSADDMDSVSEKAIFTIALNEPEQCYRRLICDLATGSMQSENDVIVKLFENEVSPNSPVSEFVTAAKIGKQLRNVQYCEYRFSCPLTGAQIDKLI